MPRSGYFNTMDLSDFEERLRRGPRRDTGEYRGTPQLLLPEDVNPPKERTSDNLTDMASTIAKAKLGGDTSSLNTGKPAFGIEGAPPADITAMILGDIAQAIGGDTIGGRMGGALARTSGALLQRRWQQEDLAQDPTRSLHRMQIEQLEKLDPDMLPYILNKIDPNMWPEEMWNRYKTRVSEIADIEQEAKSRYPSATDLMTGKKLDILEGMPQGEQREALFPDVGKGAREERRVTVEEKRLGVDRSRLLNDIIERQDRHKIDIQAEERLMSGEVRQQMADITKPYYDALKGLADIRANASSLGITADEEAQQQAMGSILSAGLAASSKAMELSPTHGWGLFRDTSLNAMELMKSYEGDEATQKNVLNQLQVSFERFVSPEMLETYPPKAQEKMRAYATEFAQDLDRMLQLQTGKGLEAWEAEPTTESKKEGGLFQGVKKTMKDLYKFWSTGGGATQ